MDHCQVGGQLLEQMVSSQECDVTQALHQGPTISDSRSLEIPHLPPHNILRNTFVIIPAFNEEQVIRETVQRVVCLGVQVIVVDDFSTDGTVMVIEDLPITILRHSINLGQGAALQTGIDYALHLKGRFLVTFDADGQHDEHDIPMMVNTLINQNLDFVLGSRFLGRAENMSTSRFLLLKAAGVFTFITSGLKLSDVQNGLRAFSAESAPFIKITQNRMAHASEILHNIKKHGLRFQEVPTTVRYTEYSQRKGQTALGAGDIVYDLIMRRLFP